MAGYRFYKVPPFSQPVTEWTAPNFHTEKSFKKKTPKQPAKVVVYGLPDNTEYPEVMTLMNSWLPDIKVKHVGILNPTKKKADNIKTFIAFVQLDSDESADKVIAYYHEHKDRITKAYRFTNKAGITGDISVSYCYQIDKSGKTSEELMDNLKLHQPGKKNTKNEDVSSCLQDIDEDRQALLSSIKLLEEELKKRVPDLFVSELEMNELQKEEDELNHHIEVKIEQLGVIKLELKDVKEKYNELLSDDEE